MHETQWLPGIVVLVAGLIVGVLFVLFSRSGQVIGEADTRLADLEQRYRQLIAQLKELAAEKHTMTLEAFAAENSRLELAAAEALKAKDGYQRGMKHEEAKASARAEKRARAEAAQANSFFGKHPQLKGALWGGGAVVFFVILGLVLSQESKPRTEGMEMSGKTPGAESGTGPGPMKDPPEDPGLKAAMDRLSKNPEDVEAIAEVSHELLLRQDFEQAQKLVDRGIGLDPFHLEIRIHRAVLGAAEGSKLKAVAQLQHLANTYPDSYEASMFAGFLSMQAGDGPGALASFERFVAEAPPEELSPMMRQGIERLRAEVKAGGAK